MLCIWNTQYTGFYVHIVSLVLVNFIFLSLFDNNYLRYEKITDLKTFLIWQTPSWSGSIKYCFSISFGFDNDLDILMYEMTLDFNEEKIDRFNIVSTDDCFLVFFYHISRYPCRTSQTQTHSKDS